MLFAQTAWDPASIDTDDLVKDCLPAIDRGFPEDRKIGGTPREVATHARGSVAFNPETRPVGKRKPRKLVAVDLFAGAGGASQGLKEAGFSVVGAIENDPSAAETYRLNHDTTLLLERDIRSVVVRDFRVQLGLRKRSLTLLKACPPCQGFSSIGKQDYADPRNDLVIEVGRFAAEFLPKIVLLENVTGLRRDRRFFRLMKGLKNLGYVLREYLLDARDFGVPQRRRRLVLLAVRDRRRKQLPENLIAFLHRSFFFRKPTLRKVFSYDSTKAASKDPLQKRVTPSEVVGKRIAKIRRRGNRNDLPRSLVLPCHKRVKSGAIASYGRIDLDGDAPTMTTRCTTPASGSFIHPTKNRAITLREASMIQTFPSRYRFFGGRSKIERQIGNALPVRMAMGLALIAQSVAFGSEKRSGR